MRLLLVAALVSGVVTPAAAQSSAPAPAPIRFDAVATDARGGTVADLRASDFELIEDGTARAVEQVRFVRADGRLVDNGSLEPIESREDEERAAARDGTRLFAIFLDDYHVRPGDAAERARAALTRFVEDSTGPGDLLLVVRPLDSLVSMQMTRDRGTVLDEIAAFTPRRGDYTPRTPFELNYVAGSPERIEALRAQVTLSALSAMAAHLGGLNQSRKTMIVLSEGFIRGERRRGDEVLPTIDAVARAANRLNVSIYAIDPRAFQGGASAQPDPARETLRTLAANTGGQTLFEPSDLASGFTRIASDSGGYYLLFLPPAPDAAVAAEVERFHPVQIRVKRAGIQLRTRAGYWTPTSETLRALVASIPPVFTPRAPEWPRHASPLIRPWFGLTRGSDGRTRVSVVWEPAASTPGVRARTEPPVQVVVKALKPDGTEIFEGLLRQAGTAETGDGLRTAQFELPAGRLRLQMSIEDAGSKLLDTDYREISVGTLSGPLVFGTPQVLRARTAREYRSLESSLGAAPVASREFSRSDRLLIRVPAYADEGTLTLSARLVSGLGGVMRDLAVATPDGSEMHDIDVPLAGLAAGEYRVELVARAGGSEANEFITFRVTP